VERGCGLQQAEAGGSWWRQDRLLKLWLELEQDQTLD
jgi:hypothetical protein